MNLDAAFHTRRSLRLVVVAMVLALIAGCSTAPATGSEGTNPASPPASTDSSGGTSTAQPQAPSGEPIRLGATLPLTGAGGLYGQGEQKAVQLTVEEINAAGGIMGRPLEVIYEDTQTNPDAGVRAVKKLIEVNKAVATFGTWSSAVTLAVAPVAAEAGRVSMSTSGSPAITTMNDSDLHFRTHPSQVYQGPIAAAAVKKQGWKTAVVLALNNPAMLASGEEFVKKFVADGGQLLGEIIVYNPNASSYKSEVEKALALKPDGIYLSGYTPDNTIVLKEAFALGADVKWCATGSAINPTLIENVGAEAVENLLSVDMRPRTSSKAYAEFNPKFLAATGTNLTDNVYAAQVRDHVHLLALAMEAAQSTDARVFRDKLREINDPNGEVVYSFAEGKAALAAGKTINFEGVSSSVDFDENGDVITDYSLFQVQGGKLVEIDIIPADAIKN